MRVDSPSLTVSQDGSQVAFSSGRRTTLVDVASGASDEFEAATTASIVALAPSGGWTPVVAASDQLSWLVSDAQVTSLPGRAVFARLADDGSVVVVTRSDSAGSFVVVLDGESFAAVIDPVPLGHASVYAVERDTSTSVVLAGRRGDRRVWEGSGEPYLCRLNWSSGAAAIDWNGEGVDGAAGALRASSGWLAAMRGTRLVWALVESLAAGGSGDVVDLGVTARALALSPSGAQLAFVGEVDHVVTLARPGDGIDDGDGDGDGDEGANDRGSFGGLSAIEFGVGDDGSVGLVGLRSSTEVVVLAAPPSGELAVVASFEVPRSVFRNKD